MLKRLARRVCLFLADDRAQATVEYALVISVTMLLLLSVSAVVIDGLASHYREVTSVVCLPIP